MVTKDQLLEKYSSASNSVKSIHTLLVFLEKNQNLTIFDLTAQAKAPEHIRIYRDSLIQRFEYSVDTVWKYLKNYLARSFGVVCEYPKDVFRGAFKAHIVNEKEVEFLIEMVDARNLTSHTYHEPIAQRITKRIPDYYAIMAKLLEKTAL